MKKKEGFGTLFGFSGEILERSPAGMLRLDEKLRIVYENPKMKEILGVPPGEESKALGTDIRALPPVKKTGLAYKFNDLFEGKEISMETPFTSIYGKKSFLKIVGVPIFEHDKFAGAVLLVTDISEYKKVEEKLRESEERFRDVAANTGEWIWEVDAEGRYTYSSPVVEQVLGYKAEEVLGKFFYDFFHPKEREQLKSAAFKVFKRREPFVGFVNRNVHKDGHTIILETSGTPIIDDKGRLIGYRGADCDVTEQKRMEEALRESEEKYRNLFENASDAIITLDRKGNVTSVNRVVVEYGYGKAELIGKNMLNFVPKKYWPTVGKHTMDVLRGKTVQGEVEVITKKGKMFAEYRANPLKKRKKIVGAEVILRDATERKKVEEALRESEELFRSVVENSHDCILIIDDKFRITYANDEAVHMSGYPKEEIIGQDFRKFLDENSKSLVQDRYLRRQKGEKVPPRYEFKIVRKNGEKRDVEIKSTVIEDSQGRVRTVAQLLDITKRKRMEEKRKSFEKRVSALHTYAQSLNMADNIEDIHTLTLNAMEKTLGFEYASVLLVKGKMLRLVAQRGYSRGLVVILPLEGEEGVTVKAARTGKPVFVPDLRKEKAYVEGGFGMLSELTVPIKMKGEVLGVLNVESKRLGAFKEEDKELLEILASHAAIAIIDLKRHQQLRKISKKLANLMKSSTEIMRIKDMHQRLKVVAKAIRKFGWRRVVISLRDENLEGTDVVTAGLTKGEIKLLLERKAPGRVWRERLGPKFERFKTGEFYYLPWSDPWIREYVHGVPPEASPEEATTYAGVPSRLSPEEMVDWHPQDMLYAPLRTPEGRIVGILSMDDPVDGRRPTRESLTPLELFLHQAAMVIENAQLIESLREAREQLEAYAEQLEQKVEERTRELKRSQEQLLKAQRLAVIGELAGMVGHDLRNPLTSIAGAAYYLKKRLGSEMEGKIKEMLELIKKNIVYSNKIINDLLDYSREMKLDLTESSPKSIITESLSLVEIPKNVQVIDLTENKPKIKVDIGKIKRAFVNIIKNGIEAMPKGGTLTIKTKKLDGNLEFVFSDTGVGMSKETVEKLWTPLFTTKAKGMGFGLPICKRVMEAHGGTISIKSARGKGTTITVTIPTKPKIEGGEKIWVKPPESWLLTTTKA